MTALQKIHKEAKRLRNLKPSMPYKDAIVMASKNYNAGKIGAAKAPVAKKRTSSKLPVKKIVTTVTKEKISGTGKGVFVRFKGLLDEILAEQNSIASLKEQMKKYPDKKVYYKQQIVTKQKYISALKLQKNSLKKLL